MTTNRHQVHPEVMLTDTVGFIQKLPTNLVAAFRATLEEVRPFCMYWKRYVLCPGSYTVQRTFFVVRSLGSSAIFPIGSYSMLVFLPNFVVSFFLPGVRT